MLKTYVTVSALTVVAALICLTTNPAMAGSSASAASKNVRTISPVASHAPGHYGSSQVAELKITEFTSSSAKTIQPRH